MSAVLHTTQLNHTSVFYLEGLIPPRVTEVYGATFIKGHGRWFFPAFAPVHDKVVSDLKKVVKGLTASPAALALLQELRHPPKLPEGFTFITEPFAHQRAGLEWLLKHPRAGLFYDPGLGKCKITVDLYRATLDPMLILCPRVVLRTWAREFVTHGGITDTVVLSGTPKQKEALLTQIQERAPAATIVTYETAVRLAPALLRVKYRRIVADESHRIKAIHSIRTKAALMLSERAAGRVLLSGTPSLGSPLNLYAQLRFLGNYFAAESWLDYKKAYVTFPPEELRQGKPKTVLGFKNLDDLNDRVGEVCLRKTQEECLDLPEQRIIDVPFAVYGPQRALYNAIIENKGDEVGESVRHALLDGQLSQASGPTLKDAYVLATEPITQLNKLEQITSGFVHRTFDNPGFCNGCKNLVACVEAKVRPFTRRCEFVHQPTLEKEVFEKNARLDTFADLLEDLLEDAKNKVIVWTRYIAELDLIAAHLKKAGVPFVRVQGGMSTEAFEGAMHQFNTDPAIRVYLGQVASGIGVTLNAANYMVYFSLPWSLEQYLQSKARNYRIGQDKKTTVFRLLALDTTDFDKAAALDQKIDIEAMITGERGEAGTACEKHAQIRPNAKAPCTCDGSVLRIVAKLVPIP